MPISRHAVGDPGAAPADISDVDTWAESIVSKIEAEGVVAEVERDQYPMSMMTLFLSSNLCQHVLEHSARYEMCSENLDFCRHMSQYHTILSAGASLQRIRIHERFMIQRYIEPGAPYSLNISYVLRSAVLHDSHDQEAWHDIQNEITMLIRHGPYLRFSQRLQRLLTSSLKMVLDRTTLAEAGNRFEELLFAACPEMRSLFSSKYLKGKQVEGEGQAGLFATMLKSFTNSFVYLEKLMETMSALGENYRQIAINPDHVKITLEVLLQTLHSYLGEDFDAESQAAWENGYALIATLMVISIDRTQVNSVPFKAQQLCHIPAHKHSSGELDCASRSGGSEGVEVTVRPTIISLSTFEADETTTIEQNMHRRRHRQRLWYLRARITRGIRIAAKVVGIATLACLIIII